LPAFSYAIITLALLLYLFAQKKNQAMIYLAALVLGGEAILLVTSSNVTSSLIMPYLLLYLTIGIVILITAFFFTKQKASIIMLNGIISLSLFAFPFYYALAIYQFSIQYKLEMQPMLRFLQQNAAHQSVVFYTSTMVVPYPIIDYAQALPGTRFNYFWMLPGLIKKPFAAESAFLLQAVATDLDRYKPKFVIIDISKHKPYLTDSQFEYLPYFSQNKHFVFAWRQYHYFTTINLPSNLDDTHYVFAVYKRQE
jgi:hypothetical protein